MPGRADTPARPSLSRAAFVALFGTTLATAIGNTGLISIMPAVGRELGISDFLIAGIFSLSALMWAIFSPYWALRSDRRGRKPFLLIGLGGFIVSMTGCGLVVLAGAHGLLTAGAVFLAFLIVRSSYGMFGSAAGAASQAYVADHSRGAERVRTIAALGGALNLGTILGPAIAPFLVVAALGQSTPMFCFALGGLAILIFTACVLPGDAGLARARPSRSPDGRRRSILADRAVRPFLLYGFAMSSAQAANTYTLGFLVIDRLGRPPVEAQGAIGLTMAAGALASLFAQWGLIGAAGMMPRAAMRWGAALVLAGNVALIAAPGFATLLGAFAVINLGYGLARPGFAAGASLAALDEAQGAVAGAVGSIAGASIVASPVLAVALYELAPAAPFIVLAGLMIGLLLYCFANGALAEKRLRPGAIVSCER